MKKIISIMLAFSVLFNFHILSVSAYNSAGNTPICVSSGIIPDYTYTLADGIEEVLFNNQYADTVKFNVLQKIKFVLPKDQFLDLLTIIIDDANRQKIDLSNLYYIVSMITIETNGESSMTDSASWVVLNYTHHKQIGQYNCAPAVARSIIECITGNLYTEQQMVTALNTTSTGTTLTNFKSGLNSLQSANTYVAMPYTTSLSVMRNCLYYDIITSGIPSAVAINPSAFNGYLFYANTLHAVGVHSLLSDKSDCRLADSAKDTAIYKNFLISTNNLHQMMQGATGGGILF